MASGRFFLRWTWADGFVEKDEVTLRGRWGLAGRGKNTTNQVLKVPSSVLLEKYQSIIACFHILTQMYKGVLHLHCTRFFGLPCVSLCISLVVLFVPHFIFGTGK